MSTEYRFQIGQLIQHKRYGYRGVVAGLDPKCRADEAWYLNNLTQPERNRPWYHVLVHGAEHTTYAAEENLEEDIGGEQVINPLTRICFEYFQKGRYISRDGVQFPGRMP